MKTATVIAAVIAVVLCGCATVSTTRVEKGMTVTQVSRAMKRDPEAVYAKRINDRLVEVVDYSEETFCLPNPIDDYWCMLPQTTRVVRVWFLDGRAEEWYSVNCASYDGMCRLEGRPEWQTPPDFDSPAVPEFVKRIRGG
ncbi:MAG: hypothetical protein PHN82_12130 [bacterium]|nr:hypothetical protein [bacterium]